MGLTDNDKNSYYSCIIHNEVYLFLGLLFFFLLHNHLRQADCCIHPQVGKGDNAVAFSVVLE